MPFLWVISGIKFYDTATSTKQLNSDPKRGYASSYFGPGEYDSGLKSPHGPDEDEWVSVMARIHHPWENVRVTSMYLYKTRHNKVTKDKLNKNVNLVKWPPNQPTKKSMLPTNPPKTLQKQTNQRTNKTKQYKHKTKQNKTKQKQNFKNKQQQQPQKKTNKQTNKEKYTNKQINEIPVLDIEFSHVVDQSFIS